MSCCDTIGVPDGREEGISVVGQTEEVQVETVRLINDLDHGSKRGDESGIGKSAQKLIERARFGRVIFLDFCSQTFLTLKASPVYFLAELRKYLLDASNPVIV